MSDQFAFFYSRLFSHYSYGEEHPFKVSRYHLTHDLASEYGLLQGPGVHLIECPLAEEKALLRFHRLDYLQTLEEFSREGAPRANFLYGLGDVENPVFPGLYEWARRVCGGTLEAARLVAGKKVRAAFNMAGGWHHAHAARASGFSYLNDAVVAIHWLLRQGLRVAYVDIDAHHGDGVQEAFFATDKVLTISLHETGDDFFPHTGYPHELGTGRGYGYSVNVPFVPHSDDLIFEQAFRRIVLPLLEAFDPDILITQMGVDALRTDPLTRLELTTGAFESATRAFLQTKKPWVALGGGGYDRFNVARAWTLIWAQMQQRDVPDFLPEGFRAVCRQQGGGHHRLRDEPRLAHPDDFARAQRALDKNLRFLERKVFPLHGIRGRGE